MPGVNATTLAPALLAAVVGLLIIAAAVPASAQPATQPTGDADPLAGLRPQHPRLLVTDDDLARTRRLIQSDPQARKWHEELTAEAEKTLATEPAKYEIVGPRLLHVSRAVLRRVQLLAGLYRLDGDRRFADRAIREMEHAAGFKDWNPSHFLDTAEMTAAFAIGYDWLFDVMTPGQRANVRAAIIELGLKPGLDTYTGKRKASWVKTTNNWNQVCNGGLTMGALAIADEEPELARQIVDHARRSLPVAMNHFLAPDGGNEEGPGYWTYATIYTAWYLSACQTALGTDFGFLASPGLADAGRSRIHLMAPSDRGFNYADGGEGLGIAPQMYYFARAFDRPEYAAHERGFASRHALNDRCNVFGLLWAPESTKPFEAYDPPTAALFRGVHVAAFRSAWGDPKATYVAFKGGDNAASHAHLDLGTFVLESQGQRFAFDLGGDDYNLPGYWDRKGKRWTYYRLGTAGQNTLTIGGKNQAYDAKAPIITFQADAGKASSAVADLTDGYGEDAERVLRGVSLSADGGRVLIQDEVELRDAAAGAEVAWSMHTRADVSLADDGRRATLALKGATLHAALLSPAGARFTVEPASAAPPNAQQPDVRKLVVRVPGRPGTMTIGVAFSADPNTLESDLRPLKEWPRALTESK